MYQTSIVFFLLRFKSMFTDKRFVTKVSVDKRGRPKNFATKENFEKFYDLETSSDDDDDEEQVEEEVLVEVGKVKKSDKKEKQKSKVEESKKSKDKKVKNKSDKLKAKKSNKVVEKVEDGDDDESSDSESDVDQKILQKLRSDEVDYARGEANLLSDSR